MGGVYTRRSPYPSFQVLSQTLLKRARTRCSTRRTTPDSRRRCFARSGCRVNERYKEDHEGPGAVKPKTSSSRFENAGYFRSEADLDRSGRLSI